MSYPEKFRDETRQWLADNCPESVRQPGYVPIGSTKIELEPDTRLWLERMAEKGWTTPTWPREYGGAGLNKEEYRILIEELQRINARPPLTGRSVNYIGPTILEFGTDAQKAKWLPICSAGKGAWAMGYSEPGAGSDLASLNTRAVKDGDNWVINGSKIWTSDATKCDYIFILCRTSPEKPKHQGISLILVDMHQPGVKVSPIALISGESPFCETYFENAIAPIDDLIGGVDNGWTVGKRLLQYERSTHAGVNTSGSEGGRDRSDHVLDLVLKHRHHKTNAPVSDDIRDHLINYRMTRQSIEATRQRVVEETKALAPGFASSAVKLSNALNVQDGDELIVKAIGSSSFQWEDVEDKEAQSAMKRWLYQKSLTIAGGTKEVQLNIIAKRVLGLPD